jgi:splicing factor 3B subunit 1
MSEIKTCCPSRQSLGAFFFSIFSSPEQNRASSSSSSSGFDRSIDVMDGDGDAVDADADDAATYGQRKQYTASRAFFDEAKGELDDDPLAQHRQARVTDRETDYQKRRLNRQLSPERADPFADATPSASSRSFREVYEDSRLTIEQDNVLKNIARKQADQASAAAALAEAKAKIAAVAAAASSSSSSSSSADAAPVKKRRRWDVGTADADASSSSSSSSVTFSSASEMPRYTGGADATPAYAGSGAETPMLGGASKRWGETPSMMSMASVRSARWLHACAHTLDAAMENV